MTVGKVHSTCRLGASASIRDNLELEALTLRAQSSEFCAEE